MRIRHLSIRNFRGIRELDWALPNSLLFCLVGRGDSTKSTILEAVRRVFHPQWNLGFDDADFYLCSPVNTIKIDVVLGELTDTFRDLEKYGHWLSGWDHAALAHRRDPGEGLEDALRIRLQVSNDLEPSWRAIKSDEDEGVSFKVADRQKVAVSHIGAHSDRHLTWSRGSMLGHLTDGENLALSLAEAGRAARLALENVRERSLAPFDAVAAGAEETARLLGVGVGAAYKAHLDTDAISIHLGGLALHDGDMPLRQLGLGSKRLLTTALQKQNLRTPHVTLIDELEIGLEPHRIARLIEHLKADASGQYFITTHSPVVLRELTIVDLHVVHSRNGKTELVATNKPAIADSLQGKIRSGAEAFLAPRIVVCEGATEAGFLRGLDDYWIERNLRPFAYQGVALFDAVGAEKVRQVAENLGQLAYDVAVLVDSDAPEKFGDADEVALRAAGVAVFRWAGGMSLEERVFADLPWAAVAMSFELACELNGDREARLNQVCSALGRKIDGSSAAWTEAADLRAALGIAAKKGDWFKNQSKAQRWVASICGYLGQQPVAVSDLGRKLDEIRTWVDRA